MFCLKLKNGFGIAFLFLCIFCGESGAQNCKINLPPPSSAVTLNATESFPVGEIFANFSTIDVTSINLQPTNEYFDIAFNLETNKLDFIITKSLSEALDAGVGEISPTLLIKCSNGADEIAIVLFTILDENNKIPVFSSTEYPISIQTPWPIYLPINALVPILVTDADFLAGNADLTFETTEPTLFNVIGTKTSDVSPYQYSVQIELLVQIDSSITFQIRASDSVNTGTASISLTVSTANIKAPIFSSTYYRSLPIVNPEVGMQIELTEDIKATDPENTNFKFTISGPQANLVEPDPENSDPSVLKLKFVDIAGIEDLENGIGIITVTAVETNGDNLESSSTILLFFEESISTTGTWTPTSSSSPTASSEASSTFVTSSDCPDFTTFVTELSTSCPPCISTEIPVSSPSTPGECVTSSSTSPEPCTPCPDIPSTSTEFVSSCPPCSSTSFTSTTEGFSSCPPCPSTSFTFTTEGFSSCPPCSSTSSTTEGFSCPDVCSTSASTESYSSSSSPSSIPSSSSIGTTGDTGETLPSSSSLKPEITTRREEDDCDCDNDEDNCEEPSNVGFIAGLAVTSILFVGAALGAGYLWFSLRKLKNTSSLIKNLAPVEKWDPSVRFASTSENTFRKPSSSVIIENGPGPVPLPRPSISKPRLSSSRVSEGSITHLAKATPPQDPIIEATNEKVIPEPEPDYRTRPDYSVRIQEAAEIIPDKEIEFSDRDGDEEAASESEKSEAQSSIPQDQDDTNKNDNNNESSDESDQL